eukprot:4524798-Prymnesium_polylepis.1
MASRRVGTRRAPHPAAARKQEAGARGAHLVAQHVELDPIALVLLHHVHALTLRARRVEGGEAARRSALDARARLLAAQRANEPEALLVDGGRMNHVAALGVEKRGLGDPKRADHVRPPSVRCAFEYAAAVGAEDALRRRRLR